MSRPADKSPNLVLAFGETLWDLLPQGPVLGGAPFNFAYRVHSLGDQAVIVTRLGQDDLGRRAADVMARLGLIFDHVQSDPDHATGTVRISLDEKGAPDFTIVADTAYDYIQPTAALQSLASKAACLYFGTLIQRAETSRTTLLNALQTAPRAIKFLDVNLRRDCFTPATIEASLHHADVLKMNLEEAHFLADEFEIASNSLPAFCEEMIQQWALSHCVVTLGPHGAFALSNKGQKIYEPGFQVPVVDTCGAGDAFSAALVHGLLRGQPLRQCCRRGNALGALVAGQPGATQAVDSVEIQRLLDSGTPRITEPSLLQWS